MKRYGFLTVILFAILVVTGCRRERYALGEFKTPSDLVVDFEVAGANEEHPNGDGSGIVNFILSGKNVISYKVDFGDGSASSFIPDRYAKKYNKVGTKTYRVTVTAVGVGGITSTVLKEVTVYYAYQVTPEIVSMLTGDSAEGKRWRVEREVYGHIGNGPGPGRPDGAKETFEPTWWQAVPNSKAATGLYDDIYVFTNTKKFTHITNGDIYGYKDMFAKDFDASTPGSVIWEREWKLSYPDYTESFDYDGEPATGTQPERIYINFERLGHVGLFMGSHKYMILNISDTHIFLRGALPGTNNAAWYVKLVAI